MCHSAGRGSRYHSSTHSIHDHDRADQAERHRDHDHHDREIRRVCFMSDRDRHHHEWDRSEGRSAFGVRRPLRFLAHKLDLDDRQVAELARILDELKIERAQAEVDDRRSLAEFSDAVAADPFDAAKAASAGERRVQSVAKVSEKLGVTLQQLHALLSPDQRLRLAYMIRTGALSV